MNVKTDYELGKIAAAREILNLLEDDCPHNKKEGENDI